MAKGLLRRQIDKKKRGEGQGFKAFPFSIITPLIVLQIEVAPAGEKPKNKKLAKSKRQNPEMQNAKFLALSPCTNPTELHPPTSNKNHPNNSDNIFQSHLFPIILSSLLFSFFFCSSSRRTYYLLNILYIRLAYYLHPPVPQ